MNQEIKVKRSVINELEKDLDLLMITDDMRKVMIETYTQRINELKDEIDNLEQQEQQQSIYDYSVADGMAGEQI